MVWSFRAGCQSVILANELNDRILNCIGLMDHLKSVFQPLANESNRRESDYGIQICGETGGLLEERETRVKMSETWERLLNRETGTKRLMFLHFQPKRPGITA